MNRPARVVGVRELRAKLSAYLRAVARGETITIGDRQRRPIAKLAPVERSRDDEALDRLAAQGVLRRGVGKPGNVRRVKLRGSGPLASDMVIEDRR
jgi:prevent-host-death family protein